MATDTKTKKALQGGEFLIRESDPQDIFIPEESGQAWLCMCKHTKNVPCCDGSHKTLG